jgi:hypothetical protein
VTTLVNQLATFAYVPWLRRGAGRFIDAAAAQPALSVALEVDGKSVKTPTLALRGAGDVVGFDVRAVSRTWPPAGATGAEPTFLALVEFDQPDLPWRFTPAPATNDQLPPWLCLIIAKAGEFDPPVPGSSDRPLAIVNVTSPAALPDLGPSWAWAHAEAIGQTALDDSSATTLARDQPRLVRSRILCPRALEPNTSYTAFLVPTYAIGCAAVLPPVTPPSPADRSWTIAPSPPSTVSVQLPIYFQWAFATGAAGDFATLVRKLRANPLPDALSYRTIDVSDLGAKGKLEMYGALSTVGFQSNTLQPADQETVRTTLSARLADTKTQARPPRYGAAYVGAQPPPWFDDLNHDPRARAAAELGAQVVRDHADALLAGAWQQAEGVRDANQELKQTQLSRELARSLWTRHAPNDPDAFLAFVAPIAGLVQTAMATTLRATVDASTLASGALSAALRRIARPGGSVAARLAKTPALLSTMSTGAWLKSAAGTVPDAGAARLGPAFALLKSIGGDSASVITGLQARAKSDASGVAAATAALLGKLLAAPKPAAVAHTLPLPSLRATLTTQIDPAGAIDRQVDARVTRSDGRTGATPLVIAPSFAQPMSAWLASIAPRWILPRAELVPDETIALLATNRRFVEAFLIGLNHALGARLVLDEYPTDLRATFARRFWGSGDDIDAIAHWKALGDNPAPDALTAQPLVVLIRGQLMQRYPNAEVFALKATGTPTQPTPGSDETLPLFASRLGTDLGFYGFPLTVAQALGGATDPGYYFVVQEHPSEPRFAGKIPDGDASSAAVAARTLQNPARLLVHARALLKGGA